MLPVNQKRCKYCFEIKHIDDMTVDFVNEWLCVDCDNDVKVTCQSCCKTVKPSDALWIDRDTLCTDCKDWNTA